MKKSNLDDKFNKWKDKNLKEISERWKAIVEYKFEEFIEKLWQEYQNENGLIDESNETLNEKNVLKKSMGKENKNKMDMKEKIKGNLENLHAEYNQHVLNYEENGEEDFNKWLDLFKEKD